MNITIGELIVWLVVGGLAGSVASALVTQKKTGFGPWKNLAIGLAGALIVGLLFNLFRIDLGLGELAVTFDDLISALLGSLLLLLGIWLFKKTRGKSKSAPET